MYFHPRRRDRIRDRTAPKTGVTGGRGDGGSASLTDLGTGGRGDGGTGRRGRAHPTHTPLFPIIIPL
uniref:Uncharacterized protein n=1 Tax=Planktothricoides sp. SpSt-374 TaxID=2282167 RepID=A0A7C3ZNB8_9CYAN